MALTAFELIGTVEVRGVPKADAELKKFEQSGQRAANNTASSFNKLHGDLFGKITSDVGHLNDKMADLNAETPKLGAGLGTAAGAATVFTVALVANVAAVVKLHEAMLDLSLSSAKTQADLVNGANKYKTSIETMSAAHIIAAQTGKTVNEVLKESNGNLTAQIEKLRQYGVIMGSENVAAGKRLNDQLVILSAQWDVLKIKMGNAITPQMARIVDGLTNSLNNNKAAVDSLASGVGLLAAYLGGNLVSSIAIANAALASMTGFLAPLAATIEFIKGLGGLKGDIPVQATSFGAGGEGSVGGGIFRAKAKNLGGGGGRGGGGGGFDVGVSLLQQLNREFFNLTEHTRLQEIQEQLLEKQFAKTTDQIKKKIMVQAIEIDLMKASQADFQAMVKLVQELGEKSEAGFVRARRAGMELNEVYEEMARLVRELGETRQRTTMDLTGLLGTDGGRRRSIADGATRPRIATVERQVLQDRIEMFNDKMQDLAAGLTNTIDRSIRDGFERGIKAGVESFALGILDMLRNSALDALEKRLADLFSNIEGKGSGAGGGGDIVSIISGKLLGVLGLGKKKKKGMPNSGVPLDSRATGDETRERIVGKIDETTSAIESSADRIIQQAHADAEYIVSALTPARQGFLSGLLGAALSAAAGAAAGGAVGAGLDKMRKPGGGGGGGGNPAVTSTVTPVGPETRPRYALPRRALGGQVTAGMTYLVGENGPEPFTPDQSGWIHPNARGGRGQGDRYITVNLTQEIKTNNPDAFRKSARQNARAARGALASVMN